MKKIWKVLGVLLGIITMGLIGGSAFRKNQEKKEEEKDLEAEKEKVNQEINAIQKDAAKAEAEATKAKAKAKASKAKVTKAKDALANPTVKKKVTSDEALANLKTIGKRKRKPKTKK